MHAFLKAVALAAAVALLLASGETIAFAQAASSAASASDTTVTISLATILNPILNWIAPLFGSAFAAGLIAIFLGFVPAPLRPFITAGVETALSHYIVQGIQWAIQDIEGFDANKTIPVNVGNAAVASALKYVLAQAPAWLVSLAGGQSAVAAKIVAFFHQFGITLDTGVDPSAVASEGAKSA